jgi:hypothetical protein
MAGALLIRSPAAEVHDGPQPLLCLVRLPLLRRRRHLLLGLRREAAGVGLGGPVDGPQRVVVVPAAESDLVLERLHCSNAHRHRPRSLRRARHVACLLLLRSTQLIARLLLQGCALSSTSSELLSSLN